VKIDRGIPVPPARASGGRPPIYPFAQMKPGDSFPVALRKRETHEAAASRVRAAAATWRTRNLAPVGFRVRVVVEDGKTVVRCWMSEYAPR
jgi:hypothetical protein